ncbi:UvrB/UvrC motif-containing protein [Bacillus timonensis]|nr:UvrB/UvrC motif-containing protein [Bacillus timonensis]
MICSECKERPATLHFTKILNGEKTEIHICEHCAQEKGEMFMFPSSAGFSLSNLLAGLLNVEPMKGKSTENPFSNKEVVQCERCKMTFQQFAKVGRFGCSNCYKTFSNQLNPVLKRLHSGNTTHSGKIPKRIGGNIHLRKQIKLLKQNLKELISEEEFEKAAKIRDQIRSIEKNLSELGEGEA